MHNSLVQLGPVRVLRQRLSHVVHEVDHDARLLGRHLFLRVQTLQFTLGVIEEEKDGKGPEGHAEQEKDHAPR